MKIKHAFLSLVALIALALSSFVAQPALYFTTPEYLTGTFVPTFTSATPPTGVTYSTQVGKWTKIGNRVAVELTVGLTSKGAGGSGDIRIGTLPYAASSTTIATCSISWSAMDLAANYTHIAPAISTGTSYIVLIQSGDSNSNANMAWAAAFDTTVLIISCQYFTT